MLLVAAAGLLAGAVGAGGTAALWVSDGTSPLGQLVAGNLEVDLLGAATWQETSADVATAPRTIDPATFLARPGDTVTVEQRFTTELRGANMSGVLRVARDGGPQLPAGVFATYTVRDAADVAVVEDVPLGTPATLPALDTDDDGRSDTFVLEVAIDLTRATADRVGPTAATQVADIGALVLTLDQVRNGEGTTP